MGWMVIFKLFVLISFCCYVFVKWFMVYDVVWLMLYYVVFEILLISFGLYFICLVGYGIEI